MKNYFNRIKQLSIVTYFVLFLSPLTALGMDVTGFDVSGIRLGMTPDQVLNIFKK